MGALSAGGPSVLLLVVVCLAALAYIGLMIASLMKRAPGADKLGRYVSLQQDNSGRQFHPVTGEPVPLATLPTYSYSDREGADSAFVDDKPTGVIGKPVVVTPGLLPGSSGT